MSRAKAPLRLTPKRKRRPLGLAKGKFTVPASFFEDLPEETGDPYHASLLSPFPKTTLREVVSCLTFSGKPKTLKEMEAAIKKGARQSKRKR
jgi:hypothetical protein